MCVLFLRLLCIFLMQISFPSVLVEKAQRKRGSSPSPAFGFLLLFSLLPADILAEKEEDLILALQTRQHRRAVTPPELVRA